MSGTVVTVTRPDRDEVHRLTFGVRLKFGKSVLADLKIDDPMLSGLAGEIHVVRAGAELTILSRTHALEIGIDGRFTRLHRRQGDSPPSVFVIPAGTASVGSPTMHRQGRPLTVHVAIPTGLQHLSTPTAPLRNDESGTRRPLELSPGTKGFLVALMLCRGWLEDPSRSQPLPKAREIARACLEAVNNWTLLHAFDNDQTARNRVVTNVQELLKELKNKLGKSGLVPRDVQITTPLLADTFVRLEILIPDDLSLLDNPDWLDGQEDRWW